MNCIFCQIVKKEIPAKIIFEDDNTLSFMDLSPNSEGHVLVIPKNHYNDFLSTSEEDILNVAKTKKVVTQLIKNRLNPVGFNFVSNMGKEASQVIFHYHEHIVPKYNLKFGYYPAKNIDPDMKKIDEIFEILK